MIGFDSLPNEITDILKGKFGQMIDLEPLRGVVGSGSSTCRLQYRDGSAVVKSSQSPRERIFYELYSQELRETGVHIADVYWAGMDSLQNNWIVLEDVPGVFPQEQWQNNPMQLQVLFNLHSYRFSNSPVDNEEIWYRPTWDEGLTELALTWFTGTSQVDEVKKLLLNAQAQCQGLFVPNCWLSGDPNPTNWRLRNDGALVMIDWERFCQGNPAIDLAITMPGLGTQDLSLEKAIAKTYWHLWSDTNEEAFSSESELAFQIRLGKLWTAVEFLANAVLDGDHHSQTDSIEFIVYRIPEILRTLR